MNLADAPSREIDIDGEMCVTAALFHRIEVHFKMQITLDGCASQGTQIFTLGGRAIPYCSRYHDDHNAHLNFYGLAMDRLVDEVLWVFAPRSQEAAFLDYFLSFSVRPEAYFLIIQHQEVPPLINKLHQESEAFQVFRGRGLFQKPRKKRACFVPYHGRLLAYCFKLARRVKPSRRKLKFP